jgi:uncharacterized protein (TIGR00269 family)
LDIAARELDADVIASAHNLDDVIQTFMINLLTGNIRALWRWSPDATPTEGVFIRRVKPFMEIYEEELAFYAYLNGLPLQSVRCPHASEGLRDKVRSFLNQLEEESPGIKHVLYQSMMSLANLPPVGEAKPIGQCRLCGFPASQPLCSSCRILNYLHQRGAAHLTPPIVGAIRANSSAGPASTHPSSKRLGRPSPSIGC